MYCILIAGMPATGKSRFAQWLGGEAQLPYMSKDKIKEILFDEIGFHSRAEKVALGNAAMQILYDFAESQMKAGLPFILENNFEDASKEGMARLLEKYRYTPVTVLFDGDIKETYRRFILRDQSPERHRGHVVNTAYPERGEKAPYVPMGLEAFQAGMERRGFRRFSVGKITIPVDCTDFGRMDYREIYGKIADAIERITSSGVRPEG